MVSSWDLFFSYRRHDLERAQPLLDALAQSGVRVWRDKTDIPDQAPITDEIRNGIANCKAFLAFYSRTYPEGDPCQQELTIAWLAAQQMDESANRRVWILNPEASFEHMPALLRDRQSPLFKEHGAQLAGAVSGIKRRLASLDAIPLGSGVRGLPAYHGMEPIQARYFAGRAKEFWDLHGKLTANRISIITGVYGHASAQVRGLGGNGKSLLAREYSIRFGPAYPGGVFWLNAYGHDDAKGALNGEQREALRQDQIREFAIRSGVPVDGRKPEEIETEFWRAVERSGQRCLWIVDDVPSGLSQEELERAWNGRWAGTATLMTTRSKQYGAVGSALDLGVLSSEEAAGLLRSHRKPANPAEESAVVRIVELLGWHPLAVEVAGSYLAQGFEGFQSYADALEDPQEDAVEFGASLEEHLPMGHERSIRATLLKSIGQLRSEGKDFLRLASILAVAPIPVNFVRETFELEGEGKARSLQAVNQAETLSLCERFGGHARTVHTLVSRTMHFQFPADPRTAELRSAAIKVLSQRLQRPAHIGEHSAIAMDIPHARHLVSNDLESEDEPGLAFWIARRDYERGDYGSARKLQERVLGALRRVLGEEHPDTLTAMLSLAQTLKAQGYLGSAQKLQEQVLAARHRLLGEEHLDTLTAMLNLAGTRYAQGNLGGARKLQEQVLAARHRLLGEGHPDTLRAMNNLAGTRYAQGDLGGARKLQEPMLAGLRRVLGEEHPETLRAMNNLAGTQYAQGDLGGAQELQEKALAASYRVLGEEHPDTLKVMQNLAQTLKARGDLGGARKLQELVLAVSRRLLGEEHPGTLTAMNNLAQTLKARGDLGGAWKLQEQVLAASRRVLGEEHPDTLTAMNNLATTLDARGDLGGARKLLERALAASRRVLGEEHPGTLTAMNNMAQTLKAQGDLGEARKLQERVLAARRRVLGEEHRDTLTTMNNLAQTLYAQGDLGETRKLQEQVLAASRRVLGEEHPNTLMAMDNLAQTLKAQGDPGGARKLQEQVLVAFRRVLGEEHPDTLTAMLNLAGTLYAQSDLGGARKLQERVLAARRRVLGEEHPDTLTAMDNFRKMGGYGEA